MAYSVHTGAYCTGPPLDRLWTASGLDCHWTASGPPFTRPPQSHNETGPDRSSTHTHLIQRVQRSKRSYCTGPPLDRHWTTTGPMDLPSTDHYRTTTEPVWTGLVPIHTFRSRSSVHSAHTALDRHGTAMGPPMGHWTAPHQTTRGS